MGEVTTYQSVEIEWNDDVVAFNDAEIEAIEAEIAKTKADLHRLTETEEQDDILLM